jgi:hypothetical protein
LKKLLLFILILFADHFVFAEPYIAIREGLKCSACHSNKTGGGKRTRMGAGVGATDLPWRPLDLEKEKLPSYFSVLNDRISFGGDFRVAYDATFSKESLASDSFETDKSNAYFQGDLVPSHVTFYVDESIAPGGAQTREIFGLIHGIPGRTYIKAGKFLPPYGLRLEDDRAFIREVTGFNFNNPDTGIEFGTEPGNFSFAGAVTNGTSSISDSNKAKQVSATGGYIGNRFRIGGSGDYNDSGSSTRKMGGVWAGLSIQKFVVLGEADWIHDQFDNGEQSQLVTYSELDYQFVHGWNFKVGYEYYDPNRDIAENQRDRVIIGIEPFITSFVHLQLFYRFNQSIPQNIPQNADELELRFHIYF